MRWRYYPRDDGGRNTSMTAAFLDAAKIEVAKASTNGHRPTPRTPVLVVLGTLLGQLIVLAMRVRTLALTVTAFVMATMAAYDWWGRPGAFAAVAVSCLVAEYLISSETR